MAMLTDEAIARGWLCCIRCVVGVVRRRHRRHPPSISVNYRHEAPLHSIPTFPAYPRFNEGSPGFCNSISRVRTAPLLLLPLSSKSRRCRHQAHSNDNFQCT